MEREFEPRAGSIADSHCHYDDGAFDGDRESLLDSLFAQPTSPVGLAVHAATDMRSSRFGIDTAARFENFYTSVGYHPENCDELRGRSMTSLMDDLEELLGLSDKIAAIGEVGLDYHYDGYDREFQKKLLCAQTEFAAAHSLPLIFHCRDATEDFLQILRRYRPRGVVHCFSGAPEVAEEIVSLGLYVGFTGLLTFKNAKKVKKSFEIVPIDRILLETDCPYMAPEPFRGRRCTSDMIRYTAAYGAQIKNILPQQLTDTAFENTKRLYQLEIRG